MSHGAGTAGAEAAPAQFVVGIVTPEQVSADDMHAHMSRMHTVEIPAA